MFALVNQCAVVADKHADVLAPLYNEQRTEVLKDCPSVDRKLLDRYTGVLPDATWAIGGTPLIELNAIKAKHNIKCRLLAKAEFLSAGGSVKDRLARRMVELIEAEGKIKKGDIIVEATSGNTGIGLALMCAVRGYQAVIVMPEKMSAEKANTMKALGAIVIRTRTTANWNDEDSHIVTAYRLVAELNSRAAQTGVHAFIPDQYKHPGNVLAHYQETATEILNQTDKRVDCIVAGAGTGGTVTGISQKVKEVLPECEIVAVDPKGSILHKEPNTWTLKDITGYEVEGIGYDFYPPSLHRDFVDEWIVVNDKESFDAARDLIKLEGMLVGGSSGTALAAAIKKGQKMSADQTLVVILPDNIRNYLTKFASDDWMVTLGFMEVENHPLFAQYGTDDPSLTTTQSYKVLDNASIGLGQIPSVSASTSVAEAFNGMKKASHLMVRDANSNTLIGILSRDDLHQAALSLRAYKKPVAELVHSSHLLCVSGSISLAAMATLAAATEGANKSRNHAILMVPPGHAGYDATDFVTNRAQVQRMSEVDQKSGFLRLVTKEMIAQAVLQHQTH